MTNEEIKAAFTLHCSQQRELMADIVPGQTDCTTAFPALWDSWQKSATEQSIEVARLNMRILLLEDAMQHIAYLSRFTQELIGPKVSVQLFSDMGEINQWATGTLNIKAMTDRQVQKFQETGDLYASASPTSQKMLRRPG